MGRGQRSEDRSRRTEGDNRSQKTEGRCLISEVGMGKAEKKRLGRRAEGGEHGAKGIGSRVWLVVSGVGWVDLIVRLTQFS